MTSRPSPQRASRACSQWAARRGLALVGDGLAIILSQPQEERFVVFGRRDWMRDLQAARDALAPRLVAE